MSELLPCPFCGGEARMTYDFMADGLGYNKIECRECGANTPGNYSKVGDQATWDWNTRHERMCRPIWKRTKRQGRSTDTCECSECGGCLDDLGVGIDGGVFPYCPYCGAKVVDE